MYFALTLELNFYCIIQNFYYHFSIQNIYLNYMSKQTTRRVSLTHEKMIFFPVQSGSSKIEQRIELSYI